MDYCHTVYHVSNAMRRWVTVYTCQFEPTARVPSCQGLGSAAFNSLLVPAVKLLSRSAASISRRGKKRSEQPTVRRRRWSSYDLYYFTLS